jgi:hypothetical protein
LLVLLLQELLRGRGRIHLRLLLGVTGMLMHMHGRHGLGMRLGHLPLLGVGRLWLLRMTRLWLRLLMEVCRLRKVATRSGIVQLLRLDALIRPDRGLLHHRIHWMQLLVLRLLVLRRLMV